MPDIKSRLLKNNQSFIIILQTKQSASDEKRNFADTCSCLFVCVAGILAFPKMNHSQQCLRRGSGGEGCVVFSSYLKVLPCHV